jgi:hypothetical protein
MVHAVGKTDRNSPAVAMSEHDIEAELFGRRPIRAEHQERFVCRNSWICVGVCDVGKPFPRLGLPQALGIKGRKS